MFCCLSVLYALVLIVSVWFEQYVELGYDVSLGIEI
jgi:hypothetical protein